MVLYYSPKESYFAMASKEKYYLNENGDFIIENYHMAKPFSSFFPGIAGVWGIPIWAFYVNRGQAIASFGVKNKDCPIMEFQPANKSYYLTSLLGFRTFIKLHSSPKVTLYDAFHNGVGSCGFNTTSRMVINSYELKIYEINHTLGLEVAIEYFPVTNDNYGALVRKLTIKNIGSKERKIELMDGLPQIIPYGLNNMFLKKLSRTVEAWMGVENLENNVPYMRLKVDPTDRPEVLHVKEGNFYLAFDKKGLKKPIVDPEGVFGKINNFTYPVNFMETGTFSYPKSQLITSRTPSCMSYCGNITLKNGGSYTLYTISGNMDSLPKLKANTRRIANEKYLIRKQQENKDIILSLQSPVFTQSSSISFDFYCRQNFLDNIMRGGYPLFIEHPKGKTHIQVFTRKHGDLERDYNKFHIEPTFFSQGNGNYRDVNQNRRCDVWFNPELKEENIVTFFNLIQTDGYNPLVIKPDRFSFNANLKAISKFFSSSDLKKLKGFLTNTFTPGELFYYIEQDKIALQGKKRELLKAILANSEKSYEAEYGEGFWIDHWHYCLDMLESYLALYPESLRSLLLERSDFTYYDNGFNVKPRSKKYILQNNRVYQYKSVEEDHHKRNILLKKRKKFPFISRSQSDHGKIYKTTLITKMITVIANKFAGLDPFGIGVEMEADKPSWYDSLNGLPGLLGSSTCETFELKRWIIFLKKQFAELDLAGDYNIELPDELYRLLSRSSSLCKVRLGDYNFWDKTHTLKEKYREKTLLGFSGVNIEISIDELEIILNSYLKKIEAGLNKARDKKTGLYRSYFINEVTRYKIIQKDAHLTYVKALKFRQRPLPLFLEGMVHAFRVTDSIDMAKRYYYAIRKSPLFDRELKMYKVNASLADMPEGIGRARIFTPGWLENESIWTHMQYKYMLELLEKGLYNEFYADFKNVVIAFHDPRRYGRSILENSSFMVSSAFPQADLHGNGFVARLTGATAEFINIWLIMCAGKRPFYLAKDERLYLELKPILPGWLFSEKARGGFPKGSFVFTFLGSTLVVYHNSKRRDTFGDNAAKVKEIRLKPVKGRDVILKSSIIAGPYSYEVRRGNIKRIDIFLE